MFVMVKAIIWDEVVWSFIMLYLYLKSFVQFTCFGALTFVGTVDFVFFELVLNNIYFHDDGVHDVSFFKTRKYIWRHLFCCSKWRIPARLISQRRCLNMIDTPFCGFDQIVRFVDGVSWSLSFSHIDTVWQMCL